MIIDFKETPTDRLLEADVCIVGSGAAGITLAQEFLGSDTQVLILESGGLTTESASQQLNQVDTVGLPFPTATQGRAREFGGATTLWGGGLMRMESSDFEPRDWIAHSGWPISLQDLDMAYRRVEQLMGIDVAHADNVKRRRGAAEVNLDLLQWNHSVATRARRRVSDHHQQYRDRFVAVFRQSSNIHLLLHATASELLFVSQERVEGVEIRALSGKQGVVRADTVVLAAGGIEIPRLLLQTQVAKTALRTKLPAVGRYFQARPKFSAGNVVTETHSMELQNRFGRRKVTGYSYRNRLTLAPMIQRRERLPKCDAGLLFELPEDSGLHVVRQQLNRRNTSRSKPGDFLQTLRALPDTLRIGLSKKLTGRYPQGLPLEIRVECRPEQTPDPDSRIVLSRQCDALGLPRPEIHWKIREQERRSVCRMMELLATEFTRLGWGKVIPAAWLQDTSIDWRARVTEGNHHSGTTRMSISPQDGVVDRDCQVHGLDNLFICSSSVFPTTGIVAPTFTIMALAVRLGEYLKSRSVATTSGVESTVRSPEEV